MASQQRHAHNQQRHNISTAVALQQSLGDMENRAFAPSPGHIELMRKASQPAHPQPSSVCPQWWCCQDSSCTKQHFQRVGGGVIDRSIAQCNWLDRCEGVRCTLMHFEPTPARIIQPLGVASLAPSSVKIGPPSTPSQWINCDVRQLDFSVLGTFDGAIMLDPPWSIKMELSYDLMNDREIENLNLASLHHGPGGYMFLWVTTRALDLGRKCLARWGYEVASEVMWVKCNQLDELSDRGCTGHWLNHSKEHLLIGMKPPANDPLARSVPGWTLGLDCDVIVSQVRESSRKPEELLDLIARAAPAGSRNLEIFGREHNCRPDWLILGNQLRASHVLDPVLVARLHRKYGSDCLEREMVTTTSSSGAGASSNPHAASTPGARLDKPGYKPWRADESQHRNLSQHYINTFAQDRPQNFLLPSTWRSVGKIHELETRVRQLVALHAHPPVTLNTPVQWLHQQLNGVRFNCMLVTPPWHEYNVRNLGVGASWSADRLASLPIAQIAARSTEPVCLFLSCGSWPVQYAQARELLRLWGFIAVEDIAVLYTSHDTTNKHRSAHLHHDHAERPVSGVCNSTYERILLAVNVPRIVKGQVPPFVHRNCATDVLVSEMPVAGQYGRMPPCVFDMIELFCSGTRRVHLFAPPDETNSRISHRPGWVRVVDASSEASTTSPSATSNLSAVYQNLPSQLPFDERVSSCLPRNPAH